MEKITLPVPEAIGVGAYDGLFLEFSRARLGFTIKVFEREEFVRLISAHHGVSYEMRKRPSLWL